MKMRQGTARYLRATEDNSVAARIAERNGITREQAGIIARNLTAGRRVALARAHGAQLRAIHDRARQATAGQMANAFAALGR